MTRRAAVALACCLALQSFASFAQERKPRVGVVLGGGGARGVAHLGVLKVLEGMRIPVSLHRRHQHGGAGRRRVRRRACRSTS